MCVSLFGDFRLIRRNGLQSVYTLRDTSHQSNILSVCANNAIWSNVHALWEENERGKTSHFRRTLFFSPHTKRIVGGSLVGVKKLFSRESSSIYLLCRMLFWVKLFAIFICLCGGSDEKEENVRFVHDRRPRKFLPRPRSSGVCLQRLLIQFHSFHVRRKLTHCESVQWGTSRYLNHENEPHISDVQCKSFSQNIVSWVCVLNYMEEKKTISDN